MLSRAFAGIVLVLLLPLVAAPAHAQAPPVPLQVTGFALGCPGGVLDVPFKGAARLSCTLFDLTHDAVRQPGGGGGAGTAAHLTTFAIQNAFPAGNSGWQALLGLTFAQTYGGDQVQIPLLIQNTPLIHSRSFDFEILASFTGANGEKANQTIPVHAQVAPYDFAHVDTVGFSHRVGQGEITGIEITITNDGVYPDSYQIDVAGPRDYYVPSPPNVYVPAQESRNVTISILTPKGTLYELGRSDVFIIRVSSVRGTGVYSTVGLLNLEGPYVPLYWIPVMIVGLAATGIVVGASQEIMQIRRLEAGRPRRVAVTPRQAVLLQELKRSDPEAYKKRKAQLDAIYAARRAQYKTTHAEQVARDRAEHKQAMLEFKAEKKRRKAQHSQEMRDKKAAKSLARKEAKAEAKLVKAKEKQLKVARKRLAKAQVKQAKVDAKQAKADAKVAAAEAKVAAKAAAAAAKAEKAAQKAARKQKKG